MIRRVLLILATLLLATPANAQDLLGPAYPGGDVLAGGGGGGGSPLSQLGGLAEKFLKQPGSDSITPAGGLNPLEVMAEAGQAVNGRSSSASSTSGDDKKGGLSTTINVMLVLTVISLAPSLMLMMTCFMRVLIVLGFLKQALGTQSIPPPQVTTALALFVTMFVMAPTVQRIEKEALEPWRSGEIRDYNNLWDSAKQPIRDFMFSQIEASGNWSSLYMLMEHRGKDISRPELLSRADVDMVELVPGYMLSELKVAFLMGFRVYVPFLVIDMVISTMLISMSMMMLPPVLVSLPFKVLLFVMVDGWTLVVGSLMKSISGPASHVALLGDGGATFMQSLGLG